MNLSYPELGRVWPLEVLTKSTKVENGVLGLNGGLN